MIRRLRAALPGRREIVLGTPLWGALLLLNAATGLAMRGWSPARIGIVATLFLAGGCLAWLPALLLARLLSAGRRRSERFAAAFLCLATATVAFVGGLYALEYRLYYAQWHEAAFTRVWAVQFVFTCLVALYQFAVLGLRLMFPLGFIGLFAASWALSREAPVIEPVIEIETRRRP